MRSFIRAAIVSSAIMVFSVAAQAQDWSLPPTYGAVDLSAGYTPDPYVVNLDAGGSIDAGRTLGGRCGGFVANAPDFDLYYSAGSFPLSIYVDSAADTTLVINAPDGSWYCDDDSGDGLNPLVHFNRPQSGLYDIYVGTFSATGIRPARLFISEIY